jgi:pimeloyl-ACP methyl ester carboxylesterase
MPSSSPSPASFFFSAPDGLKLHALDAGPRDNARLPVVCLPGLARTVEDFRELIEALSHGDAPRRVLALDLRGRGLSARDPNPDNYSVPVELGDVLALLDVAGIARAVFVGTSRGGILTMAMGAARPRAVAGAVLNDVGPVIEMAGVLRIKNYVGRMPKPADYAEAVRLLRGVMGNQFPGFEPADWDSYARRTWRETESGLELRYDPALSRALAALDAGDPLPALWPQFDALARVPMLVIRGKYSDLLSPETVAAMRARRPDLAVLEVIGQGHAPVLTDERTIGPIREFVERCDAINIPPLQGRVASAERSEAT